MTMFKITRKKVTFGGGSTAAEEYKRNLRKNEEENQISEIPNVVVFFWFDKRFPGARIVEFVNQLKSGGAIRTLARNLFAALP
jgi:hypothetical protein